MNTVETNGNNPQLNLHLKDIRDIQTLENQSQQSNVINALNLFKSS